jgi:hypothetical protein
MNITFVIVICLLLYLIYILNELGAHVESIEHELSLCARTEYVDRLAAFCKNPSDEVKLPI